MSHELNCACPSCMAVRSPERPSVPGLPPVPEQVETIELDRDGLRILLSLTRADGASFAGFLSPLLAAKLAREAGYLAADALHEQRTPRGVVSSAVEWPEEANAEPRDEGER